MVAQLLFLAVACQAAQDTATTTLVRIYKNDTETSFSFKAEVDMGGADHKFDMSLLFKVLKEPADGKAECELKVTKLLLDENDQTDNMTVEPLKSDYDPSGLPSAIPFQDFEKAIAVFLMGSCVPSGPLTVGKDYKIEWTAKDKSGTIKGTGKLVEVKSAGDKKIAVLKQELTFRPDGGEGGTVKVDSEIDVATGNVLKAEGTLEIEEVKGKFHILQVPKTGS